MILIRVPPLSVGPATTAAELVRQATLMQRALWGGYTLSIAVFYGVLWQARGVMSGAAVEEPEHVADMLWAGAVVLALATLLLRRWCYAQASGLRPAIRQLSGAVRPSVPSFDAAGPRSLGAQLEALANVGGDSAADAAASVDLPGLQALADGLNSLMSRERLVWTLCAGPLVLVIPLALLAGGAVAVEAPAALSLSLLALTFPRTERFAREAGAIA